MSEHIWIDGDGTYSIRFCNPYILTYSNLMRGDEWVSKFADELQAEAGAEGMLPYDKVMAAACRAAGLEE